MKAGRKRNATATGTRKNASRAFEKAPPERTASTLIAAMSTPVVTSASSCVAGRRYTQARTPALHAEKSTSATRKPVSWGFGWARPWPRAISKIAGSRSQATVRSDSAVASPTWAGTIEPLTAYSIKPRRMAFATAAARSETPSFS